MRRGSIGIATLLLAAVIAGPVLTAVPAYASAGSAPTSPASDLASASTTIGASSDGFVTNANDLVLLKVCNVWDPMRGPEPDGALMNFSLVPSGPAGSSASPSALIQLRAGGDDPICSAPISYRPGTEVTLSEGIVPGTKVDRNGIAATGAEWVVPGSTSISTRTISLLITAPISPWNGPKNEATVSFTNEAAAPGILKICEIPGSLANSIAYPAGTTFAVSVETAGSTSTYSTVVPLGSCKLVTDANGVVLFPFNSTQTIAETLLSGDIATAIGVSPTDVIEFVGGIPSLTGETVESGLPDLGAPGVQSSVSVVIGEKSCTEVTFANVAAPLVPGGSPGTTANSGGSSVANTTGADAVSVASVASDAGSIKLPVVILSSRAVHNLRVELARDQRALKKFERRRAAAKKRSVKMAMAKKIAALKVAEKLLKKDIKRIG